MSSLYLLINLGAVILPLLFSFHPRLKFSRYFGPAFAAIGVVAVPFIIWDAFFTSVGVWGFNERYLLGISLLGLPLEEILFFLCIPFSCLFTYHCLKLTKSNMFSRPVPATLLLVAGTVLLIISFFVVSQLYSFSAFALSALVMLGLGIKKPPFTNTMLLSYLILLIPFFVINGILTGTGPEEAVVWYNNEENLAVRILTIPLEDFFYGFVLIVLNVVFFEYFRRPKV